MNTFKNVFRACNGTRIAQCSLLIALAFLCLAIVFMCVFYNLNALATDNIAFAEEILIEDEEVLRSVIQGGGFARDNMFGMDGIFTSVPSYSSTMSANSWYCDYPSRLTISYSSSGLSFTATGEVNFLYIFPYTSFIVGQYYCISSYCSAYTGSYPKFRFYNMEGNSYTNGLNFTTANAIIYGDYSKITNNTNYVGAGYYFTSGCSLTVSFIKLEKGRGFTGIPLDNYLPNGYDEGYQDGYTDGQQHAPAPEPDYSVISSTGIVRDNLLNDNDFSSASYNISLSQEESRDVRSNRSTVSAEVFNGSNFRLFLNTNSSASLINNHLTTGTSTADLYFGVNEQNVPLIERDKYTLAFSFSHMSLNYSGIVVSVGFNGTVYRNDVVDATDGSLYWTFTFDLTSSTQNLNYFYFDITIPDNSSLDLEWFKLEKGDSFSGYVPKTYKLYGYNDGYNDGYNKGYSDAFVYSLWTTGVGVIPSDLINDNVSIVTSDYVSSVSALSVDNQAHTYSPPAKIGTYIDFSTIPAGASLKFDCSVTFTNVTSSTIHYYFADADYNDANWLYNNSDGSFANGSSDFILVCPRIASRLYFVSYVSETVGFQVAGLPYYKVFDFKIENENGNNIISSIVLDLDETFEEVRNTAYDNGFRDGQIKGESSHEYSFMSLFGAIYDVPVNAFNNMFNFDVFGVNFRAILLGLITLALGLFIWKIIVRGG